MMKQMRTTSDALLRLRTTFNVASFPYTNNLTSLTTCLNIYITEITLKRLTFYRSKSLVKPLKTLHLCGPHSSSSFGLFFRQIIEKLAINIQIKIFDKIVVFFLHYFDIIEHCPIENWIVLTTSHWRNDVLCILTIHIEWWLF